MYCTGTQKWTTFVARRRNDAARPAAEDCACGASPSRRNACNRPPSRPRSADLWPSAPERHVLPGAIQATTAATCFHGAARLRPLWRMGGSGAPHPCISTPEPTPGSHPAPPPSPSTRNPTATPHFRATAVFAGCPQRQRVAPTFLSVGRERPPRSPLLVPTTLAVIPLSPSRCTSLLLSP